MLLWKTIISGFLEPHMTTFGSVISRNSMLKMQKKNKKKRMSDRLQIQVKGVFFSLLYICCYCVSLW